MSSIDELIKRAQKQLQTGSNQIHFATGAELISELCRLKDVEKNERYYQDILIDLGYLS